MTVSNTPARKRWSRSRNATNSSANGDTALHLDAVARELSEHLAWPDDDRDTEAWRMRWRAAFTLGHREVVSTSKGL